MMKSILATLLLVLLPGAPDVSAQSATPSRSSSFKSGFSSQRPAPTSADRPAPPKNSSFGSFGSRPAAPAAPRKSDSALSQRLDQSSAESNALRTLDERRAAQRAANAPREIRPVPGVPASNQPRYSDTYRSDKRRNDSYRGDGDQPQRQPPYGGAPMPAPIVVPRQNNGMGNMAAGAVLGTAAANAAANAHAHAGGGILGTPVKAQAEPSFFSSLLRTFVWLLVLSALAWALYFAWKFLRRGKAASTANYSFDRN